MSWHSLPVFVRLQGRPVILLGDGEAADAKRRLLERAGAIVAFDHPDARLAVVAIEDEAEAVAAVERLRARGVLVNAVDRPALCDFTLPAIVDRDPVLVAIGTGGVSAGLAAAVRQRLEGLMPADMGRLADELFARRAELRRRWPDGGERRRALARGMMAGALLDPFAPYGRDDRVRDYILTASDDAATSLTAIRLASPDPDDLTLRQARALSQADRVYHTERVPLAILARARADAPRIVSPEPPVDPLPGLTIWMEMDSMGSTV